MRTICCLLAHLWKPLRSAFSYTPAWFCSSTAAIGGCINHNALIMYFPLDDDWTAIANLTGDASWTPSNMLKYFGKLEDC